MKKEDELLKLNGLKSEFVKWASNNEPSMWEIDINKIGGRLTGYKRDDEPIILLDFTDGYGEWYLCINTESLDIDTSCCCFPIADLTEDQIHEIRILVESWLVKKDENFY